MRYPYTINAIRVCSEDEKAGLGESWKRVLGRFVHLLRSSEFTREENEGAGHVYGRANVAVIVSSHGIPSIRGFSGNAPDNSSVQAFLDVWDQAKRTVDKRRQLSA